MFDPVLTAARLTHMHFHTLRHTAATMLLGEGKDLFNVSRLLGHADVGTTANISSHRTREAAERAATRMDALLTSRAKV